ncbi:DUF1761 domain-containing protein [Flavobacterium sp.]|uniref:DUF1761 domain-containing protein n=1 Tax=Flavobacterium sp. TaxID=239 RepID=UPI00286CD9BB|nr:DUF1761 domain-containing protein [Flavobacterium sp.]
MEFNFLAILIAALSTLFIGFIWYSDKVFGTVWMREAGLNKEELQKGSMIKILVLSFIYSFLLAFMMQFIVIHQFGAMGMIGGDPTKALPSYTNFMSDYGIAFRTFKHGALHGFMAGVLFALPVVAINALFERKSWKYIAIHAGYWIITLMVMGAIVCGWV